MNTKQVIVIRKDLKMRKGKMVSQGAHASMKVILDMMDNYSIGPSENVEKRLVVRKGSALENWINGLFTKITCSCDSLEELDQLYDNAINASLPCSRITDVGLTEFNNVPTVTAIAIGPAESEKIDTITKQLKLL